MRGLFASSIVVEKEGLIALPWLSLQSILILYLNALAGTFLDEASSHATESILISSGKTYSLLTHLHSSLPVEQIVGTPSISRTLPFSKVPSLKSTEPAIL